LGDNPVRIDFPHVDANDTIPIAPMGSRELSHFCKLSGAPMSKRRGHSIRLSPFRRLVIDLMRFCQQVPDAAIDRRVDLSPLIAARRLATPRISWCAIFLKAWGAVAAEIPELRQTYMPYPWPRFYQHHRNVAAFPIERDVDGERVVFFMDLRSPENRSLIEINDFVRGCELQPVHEMRPYRRALLLGSLPMPIRRFVWWTTLKVLGRRRAHNFGTYTVATIAANGAGVMRTPLLLTSTLHYGLFDDQGRVDLRLTFDHRVMDGSTAARALVALERVLIDKIRPELESMRLALAA